MTLDEFFKNHPDARQLFEALRRLVAELGEVELAVTKSQVAFRRKKAFAWAWMPGMYLRNRPVAPLVLSLSLPARDPSPRWKEVVEPARGRFMHHLELYSADQLDDEVRQWLLRAWQMAG